MTPVEMRIAKKELHKAIVDIILSFEPNDEELDELADFITSMEEEQAELDEKLEEEEE